MRKITGECKYHHSYMRAIVKIEDERERNANKKLSFEAGNSNWMPGSVFKQLKQHLNV